MTWELGESLLGEDTELGMRSEKDRELQAGRDLISAVWKLSDGKAKDRFKDEEWSSKMIAHLLSPFNGGYLDFITTRNRYHIFWNQGAKKDVLGLAWWTFKVRAHEAQHMRDWSWLRWVYGLPHLLLLVCLGLFIAFGGWWALACTGMLFGALGIAYAMPRQPAWFFTWAGAGCAACIAIGFWKTDLAALWLIVGALCASPALNWLGAAIGRGWGEMRAYRISVAINYWRHGSITGSTLEWIVKHFTGSAYYWMLPWSSQWLSSKLCRPVTEHSILEQPWAKTVFSVMLTNGLVCEPVREQFGSKLKNMQLKQTKR